MIYGYNYKSKIGDIYLTADEKYILSVKFCKIGLKQNCKELCRKNLRLNSVLEKAVNQLDEYFNLRRKTFDLPINPIGSEFQKKVWQELKKIPYGQTRTYKEIAIAIGSSNYSRAVGNANNKNPISIIIPCHRVIGSNKKLTGYAGGLDKKEFLLNLEKVS